VVLPLAAFSFLWLDLIRQLSYQWETNEQYAYGWFVPFFAAALLWRRWSDRPGSGLPDHGTTGQQDLPQVSGFILHPSSRFLLSAFCFLLFLLLPLRVIHEINQDWPLITWPLTAAVVALSLNAVYLKGGWAWVKHFAFPICFILVAVRWPYRIENGLTQKLMQVVASLTVEVLGWLNIPAFQRGNLIEIATGTVGVDEACSGIRSFQSTLMAALLMGELYRLRVWARAGLVGFGLLLAFGFNVIRTLVLTWQANAHGLSAIDKWHDPAGLTITVACFFCLWALALLITKWTKTGGPRTTDNGLMTKGRGPKAESRKQKAETAPPDQPQVSGFNPQPSTPVVSSSSAPRFLLSAFCFPPIRRYLLAVGLWSLFCIFATEAWYRSGDIKPFEAARWWVSYPTNLPSFREIPVSQFARKLLKYDQGILGAWTEADGTQWSVFCFRWRAGDPTARMAARGHRPEYCMVGSGHQMNKDFGTKYLPVNGLSLPFRTYLFDAPERPLYVFFCLWEDATEKQTGFAKTKYHDRLRSVLDRRRGLGQQTLEIICSGYASMDDAQAAVTTRLPELIRVEPSKESGF
jgi:exosortase